VPPEIKFCGMTRHEDIQQAVVLGARYVGVIFAEGPRMVDVRRARELLGGVPPSVGRVGVFGRDPDPAVVADVARAAGADVVQLHGDPDGDAVARVRQYFRGPVWAAVRVRDSMVPAHAGDLFDAADAVVVDAYSSTSLGGTGMALPWAELADALRTVRRRGRLVLAGGLRAETVREAVRALHPDVVDVSSGVEVSPGVKDHGKLRAFRDAVGASVDRP
jgi:phosphoribosylanthranilate isomerase